VKLQILSYNVQGLNNPTKVRKLQINIRLTKSAYDMILLQEHKLCGEKAKELGRNLWLDAACICLDAACICLDATPGYTLNENGVGRGGVCILVSSYLKHLIDSCGSLRDNRALWITFKGTPIGKMGILIVYAPNCSRERGTLWKNLSSILDTSHAWILGRDWNMTERHCDKSTGCSRILSQLETSSWNFLKSSLGLVDHFSTGCNLRYFWDNLRVLACLDRFYTLEKDINKNMILEYHIKGDSGLSDHMLVYLRLNLK
jgi:exonuclease III